MKAFLIFGLEFLVLGVLANLTAHWLIKWYEEKNLVVSPQLVPRAARGRG